MITQFVRERLLGDQTCEERPEEPLSNFRPGFLALNPFHLAEFLNRDATVATQSFPQIEGCYQLQVALAGRDIVGQQPVLADLVMCHQTDRVDPRFVSVSISGRQSQRAGCCRIGGSCHRLGGCLFGGRLKPRRPLPVWGGRDNFHGICVIGGVDLQLNWLTNLPRLGTAIATRNVFNKLQLYDNKALVGRPVVPVGGDCGQAGEDSTLTEGMLQQQRIAVAQRA